MNFISARNFVRQTRQRLPRREKKTLITRPTTKNRLSCLVTASSDLLKCWFGLHFDPYSVAPFAYAQTPLARHDTMRQTVELIGMIPEDLIG